MKKLVTAERTVSLRISDIIRSGVLTIMAVMLAAVSFPAQSPNTAALNVAVADANGAAISGAKVMVTNAATGAMRDGVSNGDGNANFAGLTLTGTYVVEVSQSGFGNEKLPNIVLRAGETATVKVTLQPGTQQASVTVYGTAEGVRSDPQIGRRIENSQIDETPILGRKMSTLPLLNSAFRQGKGTGDLFVNQTYFITGVGSRRATTFTLDGASNDEGWGRQTAIATVPVGAIQEVQILTNAFSAEFGWTTGPALNIVTRGGTNAVHGEAVYLARPGYLQTGRFSTKGFCPKSVASTCVTPSALVAISPIDIPDQLNQISGSIGGPIRKDKTFFFVTADQTWQNRTTLLSNTLASFLLPSNLYYTGHYRQSLVIGRLDNKLASNQDLMVRFNLDRMRDDNPQDAVGGVNAPSVARIYERNAWTAQANHTWIASRSIVNELRFAFLNGDPVTRWLPQVLGTTYVRGSGNSAVPFTSGQSRYSDLWGRQWQVADTLSWTAGRNYIRFGGSIVRHTAGGTGNEPGAAIWGTFNFLTTYTPSSNNFRNQLPLDQLTLLDVQNYQQPINFGVSSYKLPQWMLTGFVQDKIRVGRDLVIDAGIRYDRQTLTDAKGNFEPRVGFAWNPGGDAKTAIRGGYGLYYAQIRTNQVASYLINGLDGIVTYTATPGQIGFPTCLTGSCLPLNFDPKTLLPTQLPQRDITIIAGKRSFYEAQFAKYGLNFAPLSSVYPDKLVNPRSQVMTIGAEREFVKGLFVGADYVRQHYSGADRAVDLNAPTPFARTAQNQFRCPVGVVPPCTAAQAVTAANATRPIAPALGGVRQVNVIMNLGVADYDGLQTQISYRGNSRINASLSYTLSKATNTFEPDGNGVGANESNIIALGEQERGPSLVDQRHRAVVFFSYRLPYRFTAGTLSQFASARPFNATTGVDNNGDGATNDRPVINGSVIAKSAFRGTPTREVAVFLEKDVQLTERMSLRLRGEAFNIFNRANMLARGVTVYGNVNNSANNDFGAFVGGTGVTQLALPAFANIDPPRMFQFQARFIF